MTALNLPNYPLKIKSEDGKRFIWCVVRKKYLVFLQEEKVRQLFIKYLSIKKKYPLSLMKVETAVNTKILRQRSDIVIFNRNSKALMIVECKAPNIKITQAAFEQIGRYNLQLKVPFLVITNGKNHFCCKVDFENGEKKFLKNIPDYSDLDG